MCDLHVGIAHSDGAPDTFPLMQHCGEHNRGFVRDTAFCTQPWFHSLPFAAGKYPISNPDGFGEVTRDGLVVSQILFRDRDLG
jgi:hypothetical protein